MIGEAVPLEAWRAYSLPTPPTVNGLFRNERKRGGRVKTTAYAGWIRLALAELARQSPARIEGRYELRLVIARGRGDLDNRIKAASDLLKTAGVIVDDRFAERITLEWSDALEPGRAIVELRPLPPAPSKRWRSNRETRARG